MYVRSLCMYVYTYVFVCVRKYVRMPTHIHASQMSTPNNQELILATFGENRDVHTKTSFLS
jgi:hypothetical protein